MATAKTKKTPAKRAAAKANDGKGRKAKTQTLAKRRKQHKGLDLKPSPQGHLAKNKKIASVEAVPLGMNFDLDKATSEINRLYRQGHDALAAYVVRTLFAGDPAAFRDPDGHLGIARLYSEQNQDNLEVAYSTMCKILWVARIKAEFEADPKARKLIDQLTYSHLAVIAAKRLTHDERVKLAKQAVAEGLNVRETQTLLTKRPGTASSCARALESWFKRTDKAIESLQQRDVAGELQSISKEEKLAAYAKLGEQIKALQGLRKNLK